MSQFLIEALSLFTILLLTTGVAVIAKRLKFPYTVALIAAGSFLAVAAASFPGTFWWIAQFELSTEVLLYVFLPILLFESAYNITYHDLRKSIFSVASLATISLLISTILIAVGLYFIVPLTGIEMPFIVYVLFGALISATDPVSVLALFKQLWAPKRLTLIFEWESMFNDGTALALFLVVLSVVITVFWTPDMLPHANLLMQTLSTLQISVLVQGALSFMSMLLVGIAFGAVMGIAFSKALELFKHIEHVQLLLTISLAHLTFILSEVINHSLVSVSGVIATCIAGMVVGNYGRSKLSHHVRHTMETLWGFCAHVANSVVFFLLGVMLLRMDISVSTMIGGMILAIIVVMIARAISVYGVILPLNLLKVEEPIPLSWQHMLSWGSLRGALAIIMVLFIPETLVIQGVSVQDFLLSLTASCILFTSFIKALTIAPLMRYFSLHRPPERERIERVLSEIIALRAGEKRIDDIWEKHYLSDATITALRSRKQEHLKKALMEWNQLKIEHADEWKDLIESLSMVSALRMEKAFVMSLFDRCEVDERTMKLLTHKIDTQIDRLECGQEQIQGVAAIRSRFDMLESLVDFLSRALHGRYDDQNRLYLKYRTRKVVLDKLILHRLTLLESIPEIAETGVIVEIRAFYEWLRVDAEKARSAVYSLRPLALESLENELTNHTVTAVEIAALQDAILKGLVPASLAKTLIQEREESIG